MQYLGSFGSYVHSPSAVCSTTIPLPSNRVAGSNDAAVSILGNWINEEDPPIDDKVEIFL